MDEVLGLLHGSAGPGADTIRDRAAARAAASAIVPPASLGEEEPMPDLSAFPRPLAQVTDMAMTCVSHLERVKAVVGAPVATGVAGRGLGVGGEAYAGRARVAHSAEEALGLLEPGDVLVVPFTTPAYNAVLSLAGGLVTEEGGALSHAAVLARELGLPTIVGVPGALAAITDGDHVEVDPTAGTVRILTPAR